MWYIGRERIAILIAQTTRWFLPVKDPPLRVLYREHSHPMMKILVAFLAILGSSARMLAADLSRSFELRVVSDGEKANGFCGVRHSAG